MPEYSAPRIQPAVLWNMGPEAFNRWRAENDFPRILDFLKTKCARFTDWQADSRLSDQELLEFRIARCLRAGAPLFLYETQRAEQLQRFLSEQWLEIGDDIPVIPGQPRNIIRSRKGFFTYQSWAERNRVRVHESVNTSDLVVNSWQGAFGARLFARAFLLRDLELLNLGGTAFTGIFSGRNLEFTNLDGLRIEGGTINNQVPNVWFSTARGLEIHGSFAFLNFYQTALSVDVNEGIRLFDGQFQDLHFERCQAVRVTARHATLHRCSFKNTPIYFSTEWTTLQQTSFSQDIQYKREYAVAYATYTSAKKIFSAQGDKSEAAKYAYVAKNIERKMCASPTYHYREKFALPGPRFTLWEIYDGYRYGQFGCRAAVQMNLSKVANGFRVAFTPHRLWSYLSIRAKCYLLGLQWLFWGYGERPGRIFLWVATIIFGFSAIYYGANQSITHHDAATSLWLSIGSFATMTFNVYQTQTWLKFLVAFEGLCGVTTMGMLVAGFASRTLDR